MTQTEEAGRRRGNIRERGSALQVRLFAGKDPVTGRDVYLAQCSRTCPQPQTGLLSLASGAREATPGIGRVVNRHSSPTF